MAAHSSVFADDTAMRIVVFDLDVKDTDYKKDADSIRDYIETKLINYNMFEVIGRKQIDKILSEQKLQLSGLTAEDQQIKIGQMLNVKVGVVGELGKIGSRLLITLKLLDLENSKFLLSTDIEASSIDNAFDKLLSNINVIADKANAFMMKPRIKEEIESFYKAKNYTDTLSEIHDYSVSFGFDKRVVEISNLVMSSLKEDGINQIEKQLNTGNFDEALRQIEIYYHAFGTDANLETLRKAISDGIKNKKETDSRNQALDAIKTAVSDGKYDEALRKVQDYTRNFGTDNQVAEISNMIVSNRNNPEKEVQNQKITAMRDIEQKMSDGKFEEALRSIENVVRAYGNDDKIENLRKEAQSGLDKQKNPEVPNSDRNALQMSALNWTGWVLLAAGAGSIGGGFYFDSQGSQAYQNMVNDYNAYSTAGSSTAAGLWNQYAKDHQNSDNDYLTRNVLYAAGGASMALGLVFVLLPGVPVPHNPALMILPGQINYSIRY
jgi:TolB-like protein